MLVNISSIQSPQSLFLHHLTAFSEVDHQFQYFLSTVFEFQFSRGETSYILFFVSGSL